MTRDHILRVMTLSLRVGEVALGSSVSVSDVEGVIRQVTSSLGLGRCEVSVTLNVITLSYLDPSLDSPTTLVRVVELGEPRLDRLVALEELVRAVGSGDVGIDEASRRVDEIVDQPPYSWLVTFLAALVSVAAWVVFAGGGLIGATSAVLAALVIELVVHPIARTRVPAIFTVFAAAAVVVAFPYAFDWVGIPIAITSAVAGGLYPLLPGGALVASVTDGLSGAPISSLAKGLQALLTAAAIAGGALAVLAVARWLELVTDAPPTSSPAIVVAIAAGVAVGAFAMARSLPMRLVGPAAGIAMAGWFVAWVGPQAGPGRWIGVFGGALVIGLGAQLAARLMSTTSTAFTTTSVYVLVPGLTFYLAMAAFAQGDSATGTDLAVQALGIAGAIAAGIALGVAVGRSVPTPRPAIALWRRRGPRRTP